MSILDFNSENEVLFDPGYSGAIARVSGNIEYMYSAFLSISSLKQKKFQFAVLYPKFLKAIDLNVAFYLGCMLWGVYLKSSSGRKIVQNPCLGAEFDDDSFGEIDFLINFIKEGLNRDTKYYLNKMYTPNPLYIAILEYYREFLSVNKGFVNTKLTDDIVIPKGLKSLGKEDIKEIYDIIYNAVKEDNLEILFKAADKIIPE